MADPVQRTLQDAVDRAGLEHAKELANQTRRDNYAASHIFSKIDGYIEMCPGAQVFAMFQSPHSPQITVKIGGPMVADAVFAKQLTLAVVNAVRGKSLRPNTPHTVTIGGGGDAGYAGLQDTLAAAVRKGDVTGKQVRSILQTSRELYSSELWVLQHACLNWGFCCRA